MARKLELTEGQKAQLKANRDSNSESRNAQRQQLQELRKEIYTALESGADQATLDQLGAELGKLQVQKCKTTSKCASSSKRSSPMSRKPNLKS